MPKNQGGGRQNVRSNTRVLYCCKMEAVPSDLFAYIHSFLLQNKLPKTAKCFKKEIGSVRSSDLAFIQ